MRTARPPACRSAENRAIAHSQHRHGCQPHGGSRAEAFLHCVVNQYRPALLRYVGSLTAGDRHRAEDVVQETFVRAWLSSGALNEGQGDSSLAPWLFTVARNLAIDTHRRERAIPVGGLLEDVAPDRAEADVADAVVDRCLIAQALARLSPAHRKALVLVHLLGQSGAEAARILGVSRGTVKSRTHYALLAVRRELAALGETSRCDRESSAA